MKATWTKDKNNEGEYLVRVILKPKDPDVNSGTIVRVSRKDGKTYPVTIERVLWAGEATAKDNEFDPDVKRGDVVVLAKPQPRPKKSARELIADGGKAPAGRPETEPANEDDIPF